MYNYWRLKMMRLLHKAWLFFAYSQQKDAPICIRLFFFRNTVNYLTRFLNVATFQESIILPNNAAMKNDFLFLGLWK